MISSFWNNIHTPNNDTGLGAQILISASQTQVNQQTVDLNTVQNRGELVGLLIESLTKVAAPGSSQVISVFYAFTNKPGRTPAQLATAAAQYDMPLDTGAAGTLRTYNLPIVYQGGRYLSFWFTSTAFTGGSQQELDVTVLAKTMD